MHELNGLSVVNIELTSRCNKNCWMCGRRKLEKKYPNLVNWGDMELKLAHNISSVLPEGIIVQFHSNGEPLLYNHLQEVLKKYNKQIRCLDTNGKLLIEKANEIINNLDTLTISVIENDPEGDDQYKIVKKFLKIKGNRKPFMVYRLLGDVGKLESNNGSLDEFDFTNKEYKRMIRWYKLPGLIVTRTLHNPMGSFGYKKEVTIPEHGICLDLLSHLVIDRFGDVSFCVRFDPNKFAVLGNLNKTSLESMWNSNKRKELIKEHILGNRKTNPLCAQCGYWGCPTGS